MRRLATMMNKEWEQRNGVAGKSTLPIVQSVLLKSLLYPLLLVIECRSLSLSLCVCGLKDDNGKRFTTCYKRPQRQHGLSTIGWREGEPDKSSTRVYPYFIAV